MKKECNQLLRRLACSLMFFVLLALLPCCSSESDTSPLNDLSYDYPIEPLLSIQNGDGGFGGVPIYDPALTLYDTYYGLYCLELLNIPVPQEQLAKIRTLVSAVSSEEMFPLENNWTLDRLYYYIKITETLDVMADPEILLQGADLVATLQHPDGFFYPSIDEKENNPDFIFDHPIHAASYIVMAIEVMLANDNRSAADSALSWLENCVSVELSQPEGNQSKMQDRIGLAQTYLESCDLLDRTPPPEILDLVRGAWRQQLGLLSTVSAYDFGEISLFHLHNLFYISYYLEEATEIPIMGTEIAAARKTIGARLGAYYQNGVYTVFPISEVGTLATNDFIGDAAPIIATALALEIESFLAGLSETKCADIERRIKNGIIYNGSFMFSSYYTSDIMETYFACSILEGRKAAAPAEFKQTLATYLSDELNFSNQNFLGLMYLQLCYWNDIEITNTKVYEILWACTEKYKQDGLPSVDLSELLLFVQVSREYGQEIDHGLKKAIRRQYADDFMMTGADVPQYMALVHNCQKLLLFMELELSVSEKEIVELCETYRDCYWGLEEPLYGSYWALKAMALLSGPAVISELPEPLLSDLNRRLAECWDGYFYSIAPSYRPSLEATCYYLRLQTLIK